MLASGIVRPGASCRRKGPLLRHNHHSCASQHVTLTLINAVQVLEGGFEIPVALWGDWVFNPEANSTDDYGPADAEDPFSPEQALFVEPVPAGEGVTTTVTARQLLDARGSADSLAYVSTGASLLPNVYRWTPVPQAMVIAKASTSPADSTLRPPLQASMPPHAACRRGVLGVAQYVRLGPEGAPAVGKC